MIDTLGSGCAIISLGVSMADYLTRLSTAPRLLDRIDQAGRHPATVVGSRGRAWRGVAQVYIDRR